MKKLLGLVLACLFFGCDSRGPIGPDKVVPSVNTGVLSMEIQLNKVGVLSKETEVNLSKLLYDIRDSSGGTVIRDSSVISGHSDISIKRVFSGLTAPRNYTLIATTYDKTGEIIHSGSKKFATMPAETTDIVLNLLSKFSMLRVTFSSIPDSIRRVSAMVGEISLDSSLEGSPKTVLLTYDYLPADSAGIVYPLVLRAVGRFYGRDTLLYKADTTITAISGRDKSYVVTLKWCGPQMPRSSITIGITVGVIGSTDINAGFLEKVPVVNSKLYGVSFGPFLRGLDPRKDTITDMKIRECLRVLAPYTTWISSFGVGNGLQDVGRIAKNEFGLKVAVASWIGKDEQANQREIDTLIAIALRKEIDMAIIGVEALLRGDVTEATLIGYISRFKDAVKDIPVTSVDVYDRIKSHPSLIQALDVIAVNIYPFWEARELRCSMSFVYQAYQSIVEVAGGKAVWISETGWPDTGTANGDAIPSAVGAAFYFKNFVSMAHAERIPYLYFEGIDESWKSDEGDVGGHWGIFRDDLTMKAGMQEVFDGATVQDNWSGRDTVGGFGVPGISYTYVAPMGDGRGTVTGVVSHVIPSKCFVVLYIKVGDNWWIKPTFDSPTTVIGGCGMFTNNTVSGGSDANASHIMAFVIPKTFEPPKVSGGGLPQVLYDSSLAYVDTLRP
jgi:glucan 1,3-beta-glucosidase